MTVAELPFVSGSETSRDAARSMRIAAKQQEQRVLIAIYNRGSVGGTSDELEVQLQLTHQSASARVSELKKTGRIIDGGTRRKTRSGRYAVVYIFPPQSNLL